MKTAIALRHVAFEDLDAFEPVLRRRGFGIAYREAPLDDFSDLVRRPPDLLAVLGGPIGAHETDSHPFLKAEIGLIETRLARGLPTLGICLGCQLMARALGAAVFASGHKEIGWAPISLSEAGHASALAPLATAGTRVLHWHGDTFDLPEGAVHLAASTLCENQAFAYGKTALALQFHLEATQAGLERWYVGHAHEIASVPELSVEALRADARRHAGTTLRRGAACLDAWLDGIEPGIGEAKAKAR